MVFVVVVVYHHHTFTLSPHLRGRLFSKFTCEGRALKGTGALKSEVRPNVHRLNIIHSRGLDSPRSNQPSVGGATEMT